MAVVYEDWENELAIDAAVVVHNHLYLMEQSIRREGEAKQQLKPGIEPEILRELHSQRVALMLLCRRVFDYTRRTVEGGFDRQIRIEILTRAMIRNRKIEVRDHCADDLHKKKVEALMVYDPKRKVRVPSRFCSFHLAGFDLDDKSTAPLGPPYDPANKHSERATYSTEVISIRVIKAGPDYTYPVEVYGRVIARDEIDYKCVYLFDRERKDAQTIKSEKDMMALTGPYRALVTLGYMYFEFDLKIKGKDGPRDEVQFSKGVISYFCNPDHKRVIYQLPSFQSTVKLVLQHVALPVAASLEVSVVNKEPNHPLVHFDGKITAGTSRDYKQHMVLYDSSVRSGDLVRENGSLVLNRNLVAVFGNARIPPYQEDELVLYVCFLDASCEIEDEDDKIKPEPEDYAISAIEDNDKILPEQEDYEEEGEDPAKNVVTLKYPQSETAWEHGCPKLKVKVDWTAVLDRPEGTDFSTVDIVVFQMVSSLIIDLVVSLSEIAFTFLGCYGYSGGRTL